MYSHLINTARFLWLYNLAFLNHGYQCERDQIRSRLQALCTIKQCHRFLHGHLLTVASLQIHQHNVSFGQDLQGYDVKSDIYSVGITSIQLARGTVPYTGMPPTKVNVHLPTQTLTRGCVCRINLSVLFSMWR